MNWLVLTKFPEFWGGGNHGESISHLLLCNKQSQTHPSGIEQKAFIRYLWVSSMPLLISAWLAYASSVGWRLSDQSGAWLSHSALTVTAGEIPSLTQVCGSQRVCLIFSGPNHPVHIFFLQGQKFKREGLLQKVTLSHLLRFYWQSKFYSWSQSHGIGKYTHSCSHEEIAKLYGKGVDVGRYKKIGSPKCTLPHHV